MESIQKDFDKVLKRKRILDAETDKLINQMISDLKGNNPSLVKELAQKLSENYKETQLLIHKYGKTVEKKFKYDLDLEWVPNAMDNKQELLDQIVAHHFMRQGRFDLAKTFCKESGMMLDQGLFHQFNDMFSIVQELSVFNVGPAVQWAQKHTDFLHKRNSHLEFQLHQLEYVKFVANKDVHGAIQYAKQHFGQFAKHIHGRLETSPYKDLIDPHRWQDIQVSFCRDFCAFVGLGADPPLLTAVTVGTQALPTIHKMAQVMKVQPGLEWSTHGEMAIDIPLLDSQRFHSVFACPVSKEQSTKQNPPMMMTCGHVISKESLMRLCKGNVNARFKCPYCPSDTTAAQSIVIHF
ncbi:RING-type zinc-finger-domain-containing protein [Gorgonomyces haynaldii]|nr:RING-type zinc-finger-domain-containing protein [Gorgonomyces haynaldii]